MKIPLGMTEETVLAVIQRISDRFSSKYTFGFYDKEDISQEIFLIAIDALEHYDQCRPLENFLAVYIGNELKNKKRNIYHRIDYKCATCNNLDIFCPMCKNYHRRNNAKRSLMEPIDLNQIKTSFVQSVSYYTENETEVKEFLELIDTNLESFYREDYLKMREGIKISNFKKKIIVKRINEILEDA